MGPKRVTHPLRIDTESTPLYRGLYREASNLYEIQTWLHGIRDFFSAIYFA